MDKQKILIVEDDEKIARLLKLELEYESYDVTHAKDGREGLAYYKEYGADLIIADIMMPRMNGLDMTRRIREFSAVPIIMLTAKGDTIDKVTGLDIGASDYVTKPFEIEELLARIRANIKKESQTTKKIDQIIIGQLSIDFNKHEVLYDNHVIELTKKEFDLLAFLMNDKNVVASRDKIIEAVWGYDYVGDTNVVDVYVRYLRSKIDDVYGVKIIQTVRGVGYTIKDEA